jgi:hypothetical protein
MFAERTAHYTALEKIYDCKIISYVTGDRRGLELQIAPEVRDFFVQHLDAINHHPRIALYLHTLGGSTLAAWGLANLIRQFCDELIVIVPSKALSAGTLLSLAANSIIMTKQAVLGPIDPSVNGPLNPGNPVNEQMRVPVSVEAINGYVEFAKSVGVEDKAIPSLALAKLTEHVHPLVLGNASRTRAQIRMLAKRLLGMHFGQAEATAEQVDKILNFLCSESGSHDYSIDRKEAREELGLPIQTPSMEAYTIIKAIYDDMAEELLLNDNFNAKVEMAGNNPHNYKLRRGLIESLSGGCHCYISEGILSAQQMQLAPHLPPQEALQDEKRFEGWKHV